MCVLSLSLSLPYTFCQSEIREMSAVSATEARAQRMLVDSIKELRDGKAWPADSSARRKLYIRLSKSVHPDAGGSGEMFAMLAGT